MLLKCWELVKNTFQYVLWFINRNDSGESISKWFYNNKYCLLSDNIDLEDYEDKHKDSSDIRLAHVSMSFVMFVEPILMSFVHCTAGIVMYEANTRDVLYPFYM